MDYKASKHFDAARLVLEEEPNGELLEYMNLSMTLYLAPHQTIDIYAGGQMCVSQKISIRSSSRMSPLSC